MNLLQILFINEFYFVFSILLLFIFCIYYGIYSNSKLNRIQNIVVVASTIFLFYLLLITCNGLLTVKYSFFNIIYIDSYCLLLQSIIILLAISIIFISAAYVRLKRMNSFELYLLFLISVFGLLLLVSLVDLLGIYITIELVSLSFYILTTLNKHNVYSNESALKYFILGSISSNFILFGFSYMYMSTGITNMIEINKIILYYFTDFTDMVYIFNENILISNIFFSLFFIFIGLLFKIYSAPFHLWVPDIYNNAPLIITAFFSIVPLVPFINIILRFSFYFNILSPFLSYFFLIFACFSLFLGALGALFQVKMKRLLAFSAITHIGYFLIFIYLLLKINELSIYTIQLLFTYIIIYLITNIGIFTILVNLYSYKNFSHNNELFYFSKLFRSNWLLCFILMVFFFSISGLPPLAGFVSKLLLFINILSFGDKIFIFLLVMFIAIIGSFYYIRIIKILYFNNLDMDWLFLSKMDYICSVLISIILLFIIHFFFFAKYLNIFTLYLALSFLL